jgi:uncharacterized protein YbaR (Trm112 family)
VLDILLFLQYEKGWFNNRHIFKEVFLLPFSTIFPWNPPTGVDEGRPWPVCIKKIKLLEMVMAISRELLDILACPKCKGDINLNDAKDGLICDQCKLIYEIRDDIPIMLIDEAKPLND